MQGVRFLGRAHLIEHAPRPDKSHAPQDKGSVGVKPESIANISRNPSGTEN